MNYVEYVCPIIVLFIIVVLKISVDSEVKWENIKRIIVEASVDVMSLAVSFVISFLIAVANQGETKDVSEKLATGFICFVLYILLLILTVVTTKYFTRKYSNAEKARYLILGTIIGYLLSIPCLHYSIVLLQSLGGVKI